MKTYNGFLFPAFGTVGGKELQVFVKTGLGHGRRVPIMGLVVRLRNL